MTRPAGGAARGAKPPFGSAELAGFYRRATALVIGRKIFQMCRVADIEGGQQLTNRGRPAAHDLQPLARPAARGRRARNPGVFAGRRPLDRGRGRGAVRDLAPRRAGNGHRRRHL